MREQYLFNMIFYLWQVIKKKKCLTNAMPKVITNFPIRYAECRKEEEQSQRRNEKMVCAEPETCKYKDLEESRQTK